MKNLIDQLGTLNIELKALEKQKAAMVSKLKKEMTGSTSYGKHFFVSLYKQTRTTLDRELIPEEVLKKASKTIEVECLKIEAR